jgi:hypothetical protein
MIPALCVYSLGEDGLPEASAAGGETGATPAVGAGRAVSDGVISRERGTSTVALLPLAPAVEPVPALYAPEEDGLERGLSGAR